MSRKLSDLPENVVARKAYAIARAAGFSRKMATKAANVAKYRANPKSDLLRLAAWYKANYKSIRVKRKAKYDSNPEFFRAQSRNSPYNQKRKQRKCKLCFKSFETSHKLYGFCSNICRFWAKVDCENGPVLLNHDGSAKTIDACKVWFATRSDNGYGTFCDKQKTHLAHRWLWQHLHGTIPLDKIVCHKCDNKACVNDNHFFLGTSQDNQEDCIRKGRNRPVSGEKHYRVKLNNAQFVEVRRIYAAEGITQSELAKRFGVCKRHIEMILDNTARRLK